MKKKSVALLMACTLTVGCAVGGTMAWLTAQATPVVNTFTIGDINIDLKEHDYISANDAKSDASLKDSVGTLDTSKEVTGNTDYHFVPGDTLPKDPFVTVKPGSEACYLFVKVTALNNDIYKKDSQTDKLVDGIIKYTIDPYLIGTDGTTTTDDSNWHEVTGKSGFWYRVVDQDMANAGASWYLLKDNQVQIDTNVTKDMVDTINTNQPTLKFEAAAIQKENVADVAAAWAKLPSDFTGTN